MHKSLKNRLEALEQQAAVRVPATGPLTEDDCWFLRSQIGLKNVSLDADGRAVYAWRIGDQHPLVEALARCNAALQQLGQDAPKTTKELNY